MKLGFEQLENDLEDSNYSIEEILSSLEEIDAELQEMEDTDSTKLNIIQLAECISEHGVTPAIEYLYGDELQSSGIDITQSKEQISDTLLNIAEEVSTEIVGTLMVTHAAIVTTFILIKRRTRLLRKYSAYLNMFHAKYDFTVDNTETWEQNKNKKIKGISGPNAVQAIKSALAVIEYINKLTPDNEISMSELQSLARKAGIDIASNGHTTAKKYIKEKASIAFFKWTPENINAYAKEVGNLDEFLRQTLLTARRFAKANRKGRETRAVSRAVQYLVMDAFKLIRRTSKTWKTVVKKTKVPKPNGISAKIRRQWQNVIDNMQKEIDGDKGD